MSNQPCIPRPRRNNGRLFFVRHELENYKRQLLGLEPISELPAVIELVSANEVSRELGYTRRTLGRRIATLDAGAT